MERTRSAVWPLTMALGVGLAVGFALGYSVAGREDEPAPLRTSAPPPDVRRRRPEPWGFGDGSWFETVRECAGAETGACRRRRDRRRRGPSSSEPARRVEDPAPQKTAPAPATGRLLIRSTPAGATAFLDGRAIGRTPVTERDVAPGSHVVRVTRDGFVAQERRISVSASRPSRSLSFDLRAPPASAGAIAPATIGRASGAMSVESRPSGASVIVDGKVVGTTPMTLGEVADGTHTISLELAGHRRWNTSVKVVPANASEWRLRWSVDGAALQTERACGNRRRHKRHHGRRTKDASEFPAREGREHKWKQS